ncbi:hypothetical protein CPB83DRAFT_860955 [Crepidotus variabilis]|uniref:Uncharacterized protein n=1 Tax=Crepidotus variabilis TaxID=179855 RepID=A0A9P6E8S5_9AGAR|nr:hypothetical protein CPB83DRAFT_860955 [Crepidotus variabilis]
MRFPLRRARALSEQKSSNRRHLTFQNRSLRGLGPRLVMKVWTMTEMSNMDVLKVGFGRSGESEQEIEKLAGSSVVVLSTTLMEHQLSQLRRLE